MVWPLLGLSMSTPVRRRWGRLPRFGHEKVERKGERDGHERERTVGRHGGRQDRRRRRRRRRVRRHVHAAQAAGARLHGPGLRGRQRRRRHVVLEPLSRSPLRRREHELLLLVLEELEQEWEWTERYPAQPEILRYLNHVADRFDLRRDIQLETRVTEAIFDEDDLAWTVRTDAGDGVSRPVLRPRPSAACRRPPYACPTSRGSSSFGGRWYHTGHWPARRGRLHRPAGRRDRHRLVGHPGDPGDRRAGRPPHRVPAHARTFSLPAKNRPLDEETQREVKRNYPAHREDAPASRELRLPRPAARAVGPRGRPR